MHTRKSVHLLWEIVDFKQSVMSIALKCIEINIVVDPCKCGFHVRSFISANFLKNLLVYS